MPSATYASVASGFCASNRLAYSFASFVRLKAARCLFCKIDSSFDSIPAAASAQKELHRLLGQFSDAPTPVGGLEPELRGTGSCALDPACHQSREGIFFRSRRNHWSVPPGGLALRRDSWLRWPPQQRADPDGGIASLRKLRVLQRTSARRGDRIQR